MIMYISDKAVAKLIQLNSIREDEKELYTYGLQQGIFIILNIVTTIVIGLISDMLWQSVLFMAAYLPLRSFAGGYHARTQLRCYLYSITLIITVLSAIRFIPWTNFICLGTALFAGAIIFTLGPVEDINKPLDQIEVAVYKKSTRIILALEFLIILLLLALKLNKALSCIAVSLFALSVMLVLGKLKMRVTE